MSTIGRKIINGSLRCPKCLKNVRRLVWAKYLAGNHAWLCETCFEDC